MKKKKVLTTFGTGAIILLTPNLVKAAQNIVDFWSYSYDANSGEVVDVVENGQSGLYPVSQGPKLRFYAGDPNNKMAIVSIDPNLMGVVKFYLAADEGVPNDINNVIEANYEPYSTGLTTSKINIFMQQFFGYNGMDSNTYNVDDLTNGFTQVLSIALPNITASTPRGLNNPYAGWDFIRSNYADLHPSVFDGKKSDGKVNLNDFAVFASYWQRQDCNEGNHWCNGADLNKKGDVNEIDLSLFSEQWLCDPNTISKAIRLLPRQYRESLQKTAREILDYSGEHKQRVICGVYQNNREPSYRDFSPDLVEQLTKTTSNDSGQLEERVGPRFIVKNGKKLYRGRST
jgi:hypothetical protein